MRAKQYTAYPKYRDSGEDWIGKVPDGWHVSKFKYAINLLNGYAFKSDEYSEEGIPVIRIGDIKDSIVFSETKKIKEEENLSNFTLKRGDVLLAMTGATIGKTAVFNFDDKAYLNQRVGAMRSDKLDKRFLYSITESNFFKKYIDLMCYGGAQENISKTDIDNFAISVPCISEQKKIAEFLDAKVGDIDSLVSKLEQQLKLIDEQRNSLITETVCKGLDPKAPMKDSGIEWLGKIPTHWNIKRLKYLSTINPPKSELAEKDLEVSFLPMEKVFVDGTYSLDETKNIADVYNGFTYFKNKDVLLAKITPCFQNGKGCLIDNLLNGIGFGTTEFIVFRTNTYLLPQYMYFITKIYAFMNIGKNEMRGVAGQQRVSNEFISNFKLGVPPITEQKEIVSYLDKKLLKIDALKSKTIKQIELLKEYKTSLITNVVTGKIDVRDEVI